ncbi:MAG: cytochrome C assembly family protein [Gammaproteobacteria bacterium]|nr:MAG: cytochrome C assembly family protein [Gammaproteobacteria bacterium]
MSLGAERGYQYNSILKLITFKDVERFVDLLTAYSIIAFIAYLIATFAIFSRLFHPQGPNQLVIMSSGCIAVFIHTLLVHHLLFIQSNEIDFNLINVVSLVALLISLTVTVMALKYKANLLLPVVYGFSGVWLILANFIPPTIHLLPDNEQIMLIAHIIIALIAYCILIIATLYAFQVSFITHKLKSKNISAVNHLPPLMQVQHQLFLILAIGTFALFISQLTGFIFLDNLFSKENAHKTVLSIMALLVYCAILWGHYKKGWRGHRVLILTIIASFLLTLAYFGSRFVKEFLLS